MQYRGVALLGQGMRWAFDRQSLAMYHVHFCWRLLRAVPDVWKLLFIAPLQRQCPHTCTIYYWQRLFESSLIAGNHYRHFFFFVGVGWGVQLVQTGSDQHGAYVCWQLSGFFDECRLRHTALIRELSANHSLESSCHLCLKTAE